MNENSAENVKDKAENDSKKFEGILGNPTAAASRTFWSTFMTERIVRQ